MPRGTLTLFVCTLVVAGCSSSRSSDDPSPEPSVQEQVDSAAAQMDTTQADTAQMDTTMSQ